MHMSEGTFSHIVAHMTLNIGIKHGFSCINICQVMKTEAGGHGFQHLPRDLANFNALKKPCSIAVVA